jgi:type I restriction enzyme, R subunit
MSSNSTQPLSLNFAFLVSHSPLLDHLGAQAEQYFKNDPNTSLLKLRQFGELLAQTVAANLGVFTSHREDQNALLRRLRDQGALGERALQLFHELRIAGNDANHAFGGDHRTALSHLKYARELGIWFHRTFARNAQFQPGSFIPPPDPKQETQALKKELQRLRAEPESQRLALQNAQEAEEEAGSRQFQQAAFTGWRVSGLKSLIALVVS